MSSDKKVVRGQVEETLPNLCYRVKLLDSDRLIIAYASGKMKLNKIKVLVGDIVSVELDPYGGTATNRLIRRH